MPDKDALQTFIRAADNADAEHAFEKDPYWSGLLKSWERRSQDILNGFLHRKRVVNPNNVIAPTMAQTAYIAPKEESPLYNVSVADKKPLWQSAKNFFSSDVDYGIEDWNFRMRYSKNHSKLDLLLGEKIELRGKYNNDNWTTKQVNVGYNIQSEKFRVKYSVNTPIFGAAAEVYTKDKNVGAVVGYSDKIHNWSASISADKDNVAGSLSLYKKNITEDCNLRLNLYMNKGLKGTHNDVVGVSLRLQPKWM